MKKATRAWLIAAASLVLIGCILFAGAMSAIAWDFSKLSTVNYESNAHEIAEPFRDIALSTDTANIAFAPSEDGKCRVECYEEEDARHSVAVEGDALVIQRIDARPWYDRIGLYSGSPRITVYLPAAEYGALSIRESTGNIDIPKDFAFASADISLTTGDVDFRASAAESIQIKASTGAIRVENASADSLELSTTTGAATISGATCRGDITVSVSTGKANLTDISCRSVISTGTTGSIALDRVIAESAISIERSTGNVRFSGCDAAELHIKTSTGDVTGSLLTDKVFAIDAGTGHVDVPNSTAGGKCEIATRTGDVKMEIE